MMYQRFESSSFAKLAAVVAMAASCARPTSRAGPAVVRGEPPAARAAGSVDAAAAVVPDGGMADAGTSIEAAQPVVPRSLADSVNLFARDLHGELGKAKGNLFYAPLSIHIALSMVFAGARTETAAEMANVLHLAAGDATVHEHYAKLMNGLHSEPARGAPELRIANRLWPDQSANLVPEFASLTAERYGAPVQALNFAEAEPSRRIINAWVEQQTRERIKDLLPPGSVDFALFVLTNAIYFKGSWERPFEKAQTRELPFYVNGAAVRKAPTMQAQRVAARYAALPDAQVLELPYSAGSGPRLALVILLPKERTGLAALERRFSAEGMPAFVGSLRNSEVDVRLPRFRATKQLTLSGALSKLGMVSAFREGADFSGIFPGGGPKIHEVYHKAFVAVDEEGTEAAAATAIVMKSVTDSSSPPLEFRADHPFLFAIRDVASGTILFTGRVSDPLG